MLQRDLLVREHRPEAQMKNFDAAFRPEEKESQMRSFTTLKNVDTSTAARVERLSRERDDCRTRLTQRMQCLNSLQNAEWSAALDAWHRDELSRLDETNAEDAAQAMADADHADNQAIAEAALDYFKNAETYSAIRKQIAAVPSLRRLCSLLTPAVVHAV
jgi:hypothetical protein